MEVNDKPHGIAEDLGAEIGYTATAALIDWFGGGNLYIPTEARDDHPIGKIIGMPAFRRLVAMFDGRIGQERTLWLPFGYQREIDRRDRLIALLLHKGVGTKSIAGVAGMTERHVQKVRVRVEQMGLLPLILRQAGENCQEKPDGIAGDSPQKNTGVSAAQSSRKCGKTEASNALTLNDPFGRVPPVSKKG